MARASNSVGASDDAYRTELVTIDVEDGHEEEYAQLRSELDAAAEAFPGFQSGTSHELGAGRWLAVLQFDTPEHLSAWQQSEERGELLKKVDLISVSENEVVPTGFGRWFAVSARDQLQTPVWKQAMVVVAVLYAMVSVLDITLGNAVGKGLSVEGSQVFGGLGLPFPVVVFIGNAVGTVILTWVLMPIVVRLMDWWLRPDATPKTTGWGVVVLVAVYALEVTFFTWVNSTFGF